jgi:hypothetical protein
MIVRRLKEMKPFLNNIAAPCHFAQKPQGKTIISYKNVAVI